ncbi:MAG: tetratricopeptide repeat protein [Kiritimatiellia bacterium]
MIRSLPASILLLCALISPLTQARDRPVHDESIASTRKFSLFRGPSRDGPEAQWERVQELVQNNQLRKAIRQSRYLVEVWPDHALAARAQRLRADLLFARGEYVEAFHAYQALIDNYIGSFSYDEILKQQLEAARKTEQKVYNAFFGLSSFTQPLEAVPLYRQMLTNAPHIEQAPRILFDMGEIYFQKKQYLDAIQEFRLLEERYPNHPLAEQSALRIAEAYSRIAKRNPTDIRPKEGEYLTLSQFLGRYPESERLQEVRDRRKAAYDHLAKMKFEQGQFYENVMNRPEAARIQYQSVLEQFPDSSWTGAARERILNLSSKEN